MIYYCADDYGMSPESCDRIEKCIKDGVLNKVSVLPNGAVSDVKARLAGLDAALSLHLNLVEGRPLSQREQIPLLTDANGIFKHSFIGLCLLSFSGRRKALERQVYTELQSQIAFWKAAVGDDVPMRIDSHQHTHMIPLIFKTLLRVIDDEGVKVQYLRIPAEPVLPYIQTPTLYFTYSPVNLIKQWLLKWFGFINRKRLAKAGIPTAQFMGVLFSGRMDTERVRAVLAQYKKHADKHNLDIELAFHPGYLAEGEILPQDGRAGFAKFYLSPDRKLEYDTLLTLK